MNQTELNLIFALLRAAVCNQQMSQEYIDRCDAQSMTAIFKVAEKHGISHLIGYGLSVCGLKKKIGEIYGAYEKQMLTAAFRYERADYALKKVCGALEAAEIEHMPLKGSVLAKHYPEPWLRVGCDIDILVPAAKVDLAAELLCKTCGFTKKEKGSHDICLVSANGQIVELHYDLIEDSCSAAAAQVLKTVWDTVQKVSGTAFCYTMCDAMQYFYHIAHMAKHFENGGCGIRPFIDLWVLDSLVDKDASGREQLLIKGGLDKFSNVALQLSIAWREGRILNEDQVLLQNYILAGGAYGTLENKVNIHGGERANKLGYLLSRLFLPYNVLKYHYPVLQKHKWLAPFMQVVRWFRYLDPESRKRANKELKYNRSRTESSDAQMQYLRILLGLSSAER